MQIGISSLVSLQFFTVFPEYFISVSIIYVLIVVVLTTYNVYGLMIQKALSECMALILLMSCYLMLNDDVMVIEFFDKNALINFDYYQRKEILNLTFSTFNNSIITDYFSFFTKFIICFFSSIYFFIIADSLKEQKLTSFEYLLVILFAILGLILLCSSNDLLTAYLAIELSSLAFYILASFKKTSSYSAESGIKYFVIGAISSAFFLLGSSFIYGLTGSINFSDFFDLLECYMFNEPFPWFYFYTYTDFFDLFLDVWNYHTYLRLVTQHVFFNYDFIELGLTLILFSLFIKLAAAPFHLWSLDVYEGSPTSSTFFFAVITKLSIFVLLVRLCYVCFFRLQDSWQFYSVWVGVFSIFVGSFGGLKQRKLKTLLAYSSVSHMGYVLIAFSTSTYLGVQMLLFYLIIYMLSGLCVWSILLFLRLKHKNLNKYNKELSDLALLKNSNPTVAFALALTMFSIAGIPPMIGFVAKMNVFMSVIGISFYLVALTSILCSVISTFYYIRIIKVLYFEKLLVGKLYYPITTKKTVLLSLLIFSIIFLFLSPTLLYLLNDKVALTILI